MVLAGLPPHGNENRRSADVRHTVVKWPSIQRGTTRTGGQERVDEPRHRLHGLPFSGPCYYAQLHSESLMDEDRFNMALRKFLKEVGLTT